MERPCIYSDLIFSCHVCVTSHIGFVKETWDGDDGAFYTNKGDRNGVPGYTVHEFEKKQEKLIK